MTYNTIKNKSEIESAFRLLDEGYCVNYAEEIAEDRCLGENETQMLIYAMRDAVRIIIQPLVDAMNELRSAYAEVTDPVDDEELRLAIGTISWDGCRVIRPDSPARDFKTLTMRALAYGSVDMNSVCSIPGNELSDMVKTFLNKIESAKAICYSYTAEEESQ